MKLRISGIYKIENIINKKVYIGSAIDIHFRLKGHKRLLKQGKNQKYLQNAWNKYGSDSFSFNILEVCSCDILLKREQYWMDYYQSYESDKGYNICSKAGSVAGLEPWNKGRIWTNKERFIIKIASKSFWNSPEAEETKEKLRQINLGKKHTEESKLKCSLAQKGKPKEKAKLRTPEENAIVSQNISKGKKGKKMNMTPEQFKERNRKAWESRRANGKGKGGYKHTKKRSAEMCAKVWESRRRNGTDRASAETKKKLSDYNKKYRTGVNHPRYGTIYPPNPHSPETIQKITLTKRHKAMNQKQIKLYKTLYPNSYGDLLNIVNY